MPLEVSGGRVDWSVERYEEEPQPLTMIGRAEQVDLVQGVSSTSSCGGCCSNAYSFSFMSPGSGSCPVGGTFQFHAMQVNEDCFGNLSAPFVVTLGTWTSSNTAVATSAGGGLMNGVSEGSVTVTKKWTAFTTGDGDPNATCNSGKIFPTETAPLTVVGSISVGTVTVSPTTINSNTSATVSITLSTSSTVQSTTGTTLEVLITDATGDFSLTINPIFKDVNLSASQTMTFTFTVSLKTGSGSCRFAGHVNAGPNLTVANNDVKTVETVTISP